MAVLSPVVACWRLILHTYIPACVYLRRHLHGTSEDDVPVPPLVKTALVWGLFMGVSSNLRYQVSQAGRGGREGGAQQQGSLHLCCIKQHRDSSFLPSLWSPSMMQ
jgi:hypothetical protein